MKKLLSSDWLKTSAFIKKHGCKLQMVSDWLKTIQTNVSQSV